jgi:hypothetical protein
MNGFKLFAMAVAVIVGIPVAAAVASNRLSGATVVDEPAMVCELSVGEHALRPARPDRPTPNILPARHGLTSTSRV